MDPITKMAQEFMRDWYRFRESGTVRFFRIDTDPSMHADLWRLFRAIEMAPDNRSPYFLFDTPFKERSDFYQNAAQKLASDYDLLRNGLSNDGVQIPPLDLSSYRESDPEGWFAENVTAVWEQVRFQFDYLVLIFLPGKVEQSEQWCTTMERLVETLSSPHIRIAVADTLEPRLTVLCKRLDHQALMAPFFLSNQTLQDYLLRVAAGWGAFSEEKKAAGVAESEPVDSQDPSEPADDSHASSGAGKPLPPGEASRLRTYMAQAAKASGEQDALGAIDALRQARGICRRHCMTTHEAILTMALANTFFATEQQPEALTHYEEAVRRATLAGAPMVVMQSRLGAAGILMHTQNYEHAADAYEQAAEDASAADTEVMRIEALRMAGVCHLMLSKPESAANCWNRGLKIEARVSAEELTPATFPQIGKAFAAVCDEHGLTEQAESVRRQLDSVAVQNGANVANGTGVQACVSV